MRLIKNRLLSALPRGEYSCGEIEGRGIGHMQFGIRNSAAALFLAAALSGCAPQNLNPVTGKAIYTPVPAATEAYYGKKASTDMVASYGVYRDATLTAYVDRIGQTLAKNVVRKDVKYTFSILDDDDINAHALPGGYVYITRGALNYANSEAEIAALLAHEIGHVDAFHFGKVERNTVKRVLAVLLQHSSRNADDRAMAKRLADEATKSAGYSQQQEFEADALAVHYLALAGYDPQALVTAIRTEDAKATLDQHGIKDNQVARDIFALDQSHPATPEREARAQKAVKESAVKASAAKAEAGKAAAMLQAELAPGLSPQPGVNPQPGFNSKGERDAHLAAIDGMTFGHDPAEGTADGSRLVNATLGFAFEAPQDFDLWVGHGGAIGVGQKAVLILDVSEPYKGQSLTTYVQSSMMDDTTVNNVRPLEIDGYRGATGVIDMDPFVIRLGAVHDKGDHLYQLLYVSTQRSFRDIDADIIQSLKSFRPLKGPEANPKPTLHIRIVTAANGDTAEKLAARMAVADKRLEWFRLLNGLAAGDAVKPGDKVKVVE
jgi:predicted Zn-dependent protease